MTSRAKRLGLLAVAMSLVVLPAAPSAATPDGDHGADHDDGGPIATYDSRESTKNLKAMGHSFHPATFATTAAQREVSSDIAFWGNYAIHGNYDGFRIVDIKAPGNPKLISHPRCNGDQGDVYVYENIVVRSWNSPAPEGRECMGEPVPVGFEGVHVFDISDPANPVLVTSVEFSAAGPARGEEDGCGSHTVTGVPDLGNDRLVVYSNNSSGGGRAICDNIDVLEVPLADPAAASHIGRVPLTGGSLGSNNGCHDAGVILGDANLLACASGHAANVFSIGGERGGSLESPQFLYTIEEEEYDADGNLVGKVGIGGRWHTATFSWDGQVLSMGWEPGGGGEAECEAGDADIKKSMFFYDANTGEKLGQWVLPNPQGPDENCTIHNWNVVPLRDGRNVAVGGHYQAGTWVVDFTDPANPRTVAYSDPASMGPGPFCGATNPPGCQLGGAWSTYYYNNFIYESEIQTGLNVFRLSGKDLAGAMKLPYLNPQTQPFTIS
jgi:hypothetical protein